MKSFTKFNKSLPYYNDTKHYEICECSEPIDPFGICFHNCEETRKRYFNKMAVKNRNSDYIKRELDKIRDQLEN